MKLPPGKIPKELLERIIFKNLGARRKEVVVGPSTGIDCAIVNVGDRSLVTSMDPITGAIERIGWLAVNVNANDVATFGVQPSLFLSCILLPENSERKAVETICTQMDRAAKGLEVAIVGGHCETTPNLKNPIVIGCMMGEVEKGKYVTAGGAKPGDKLILTKSTGLEGTAILASDREKQLKEAMNPRMLQDAKSLFDQISVVPDAITAFETGGVDAMHDPTEGGVAGGIHEMADASNLGVRIIEEEIRIQPETAKICDFFKIDPLQLVSSGALLVAVQPNATGKVVGKLREKNVRASIIGDFVEDLSVRTLQRKDGTTQALPRPVSDHLWLALQKK